MTHKSEDYKISAVKYYLKNKDNIRKTCKNLLIICPILNLQGCKRENKNIILLKRW